MRFKMQILNTNRCNKVQANANFVGLFINVLNFDTATEGQQNITKATFDDDDLSWDVTQNWLWSDPYKYPPWQ